MYRQLCLQCILLAVVLFCTTGCGKHRSNLPTQYVEGRVLLNGSPLEAALVTFAPKDKENGSTASGYTDKNGSYTLTASLGDPGKGAIVGEYTVTVNRRELITEKRIVGGEESDVEVGEKFYVPKVYRTEMSTPLSATVVKGKNTFDLALEGTP